VPSLFRRRETYISLSASVLWTGTISSSKLADRGLYRYDAKDNILADCRL
jgi:hypothetical protein